MADDPLPLATEFPSASYEDWRASVEEDLGGRSFEEALVSKSRDGIAIEPLYCRADLPERPDPAGFPGAAPYLRGACAARGSWEIRQRHDHPDPKIANEQILKDLERGVTAIALTVDSEGRDGVAIGTARDLARTLADVDMALAPVHLEAGKEAPDAALMLMNLWASQGVEAGQVRGGFGYDPLAAFAVEGGEGAALSEALAEAGRIAASVSAAYPKASALAVSTRVWHSAGATEALELALMLSAAVAYLRVMEAADLDLGAAAGQIPVTLMAECDIFLTIAKLRAARALMAHMLQSCGVEDPPIHIGAETAPLMLARRDPWVNVLRATAACFGAAMGCADTITVAPHTAAFEPADRAARRIARNVQIILAEEAHVGRVLDPAGGSFAIESLTRDLALKAWQKFQALEAEGGIEVALARGELHERLATCWTARERALATRQEGLIGVSEYPDLGEEPAAAPPTPEHAAETDSPIPPLPRHRLAEVFERLRDRADDLMRQTGARPRIFLATLGSEADYIPRATWVGNLFAAAGIEAVSGSGGTDADQLAAEWRESRTGDAVLCGPDVLYADHLVPVAHALKRAGVRHLSMVGNPGKHEAVCRKAGVDAFLYDGIDLLVALGAALERAGGTA